MNELRAVLAGAAEAVHAGEPAVLATVVRTKGSSYRRPGARLLIRRDGRLTGGVSGGCLEADVARKAWWRTEGGPAVVRYDTATEGEVGGYGLGCGGVIDILLERVIPEAPSPMLSTLKRWQEGRRPGALARVIAGPGIGSFLAVDLDGNTCHRFADHRLVERVREEATAALAQHRSRQASIGPTDVFVEVVKPPVSLVICGAGYDVPPMVRLAAEIGWHVVVVDPRGRQASPGRFPEAAETWCVSPEELPGAVKLSPEGGAVLMTHHYPTDLRLLRQLLGSPLGYIGLLGPRHRRDDLLGELHAEGSLPEEADLGRLFGPVGLDLGGESPAEIALAVVAEARAVLSGRSGGSLRERATGHRETGGPVVRAGMHADSVCPAGVG